MKRYQVSPYFKFTVILAATSIFLLVLYFTELLQYYFPKQINEFNISNLKNKQYVSVTSHECIPAPGSQGNASNSVFLSLTNEYHIYRLRVGEQGSIEVGIYDKNMIQTLESWPEGKGNSSITVIARVTVDSGRAILLQVTPSEMKTHYGVLSFVAGILLIVTLLMFLTFGGIKMVYEKPFEDSRRYKEIYLGQNYHLEEELAREKNMMERYQQEREKNKSDFKLGLGITFGAFLVFAMCMLFMLAGSGSSVASGLLAGISVLMSVLAFYVFLWGIKILWNAYVNSDSPTARKISEQFMLHTLSIRREESAKLIRLMTIKLEEQKEKMKKLEEENQRLWQGSIDRKNKEELSIDESNIIK